MKITAVDVFLLQKQLSSSMRISRGGFSVRKHAIVRVSTDAGITGLGEGIGNAELVATIVRSQMARAVQGADPFNIESLRFDLLESGVYYERKGSAVCAASAIEMACWDIKGKALGVPCYQLLGGRVRNEIPAYASDIYWEENPDNLARNAERILALGVRAVKAHLGCAGPKAELERIRAIRRAIGYDTPFMVDLNAGYRATDAAEAVQRWASESLTWLEEPLHPDEVKAMALLRQKSPIPIAAGENEFRVSGFKHLFEENAVDVAMPDIGRAGGIQETKEICSLALSYGVPVSPHNFSSGVLLAATLHVMASTRNTTVLEVDTSANAVYDELLVSPLEIKDGNVRVPDAPGLGVELRPQTIEKYLAN